MNHELVSRAWDDRLVHAHDASVYRLIPRAVARPQSLADVQSLLTMARSEKIGLTFRAGGTSLSGQSVTEGLLVLLGRAWASYRIHENSPSITCGPALRGAVANAALSRFDRRIGPDPASIQAACMGGIVANNASGMCCGIEENSYQTLEGLKLLLASGTVLDTRDKECDEIFRATEPKLFQGLMQLRDKVLSSSRLVELIRRKSSMKNTTGYGLQAFLDYSRPSDLLAHLMVGSEGTLAFIAEMTLRTVPLRANRASALLSFNRLEDACEVTPRLRELGFSAIELLDFASIQAIRHEPQLPGFLREMNKQGACLLLQAQEENPSELNDVLERAQSIQSWKQIAHQTQFLKDAQSQNQLWELRKGIFPAVGARRPRGTSVIIEDIAFQLPDLARGTLALRSLLEEHGYQDAVIYGHARDGNLHFILSQNFALPGEVRRYEKFIDAMVECVAGQFGGSLKAEHGTGRNMAPFVEKEWGQEAYLVMRELKTLLDPDNILNPGVLINANPRVHLEHLKESPLVDEQLDACIECGFCEPVCPSQGLTLSPRDRIVLEREKKLMSAQTSLDSQTINYAQIETCAADGLCAKACPVGINTGTWVKKRRFSQAGLLSRRLAQWSAREMPTLERFIETSLKTAEVTQKIIGPRVLEETSRVLNSSVGLPIWSQQMTSSQHKSLEREHSATESTLPQLKILLMRSCINRTMSSSDKTSDPLLVCAQRADVEVVEVCEAGLCCGQPWSSKGFQMESQEKLGQLIERCFELSNKGEWHVVIDNSPCAQAVFDDSSLLSEELRKKLAQLKIWDPVDLALQLVERLPLSPLKEPTRFFPVCSVVKSGRVGRFEILARTICEKPIFPLQSACCGMAGDRGLWFPELSANATERFFWSEKNSARGFCSSRTCEIALSANGAPFESIYVALEMASRGSSAG